MKPIEGLVVEVEQCIFCLLEKNSITMPLNEDGNMEIYTREQCKKDYREFLNKLKDNIKTSEDIKKFLKGEILK